MIFFIQFNQFNCFSKFSCTGYEMAADGDGQRWLESFINS